MQYQISQLADLRVKIAPQRMPSGETFDQYNCLVTGSTFCCCSGCNLDVRHADVLRRFGHQVLGEAASCCEASG